MINSHLKFKAIEKDRLFYDRFQYCISFGLAEISCLREQELDRGRIGLMLDRRKQWREVAQQRWGTLGQKHNAQQTILTRRWNEITDEIGNVVLQGIMGIGGCCDSVSGVVLRQPS